MANDLVPWTAKRTDLVQMWRERTFWSAAHGLLDDFPVDVVFATNPLLDVLREAYDELASDPEGKARGRQIEAKINIYGYNRRIDDGDR